MNRSQAYHYSNSASAWLSDPAESTKIDGSRTSSTIESWPPAGVGRRVRRRQSTMRISILTQTGKTIPIEVEPSDTRLRAC